MFCWVVEMGGKKKRKGGVVGPSECIEMCLCLPFLDDAAELALSAVAFDHRQQHLLRLVLRQILQLFGVDRTAAHIYWVGVKGERLDRSERV